MTFLTVLIILALVIFTDIGLLVAALFFSLLRFALGLAFLGIVIGALALAV